MYKKAISTPSDTASVAAHLIGGSAVEQQKELSAISQELWVAYDGVREADAIRRLVLIALEWLIEEGVPGKLVQDLADLAKSTEILRERLNAAQEKIDRASGDLRTMLA